MKHFYLTVNLNVPIIAGQLAQQKQAHQHGGGTIRGSSRGSASTAGVSSSVVGSSYNNDTIQRKDFMRTPDPGVSG